MTRCHRTLIRDLLTIDGFARPILLVNDQTPGPVITAEQGETMVVEVINGLVTQIGMHW